MVKLLLFLMLLPSLAWGGFYCTDGVSVTQAECLTAGGAWKIELDSDGNNYLDVDLGGFNLDPSADPSGARVLIGAESAGAVAAHEQAYSHGSFLTSEIDPTVPANLKDGVDYSEVTGTPTLGNAEDGITYAEVVSLTLANDPYSLAWYYGPPETPGTCDDPAAITPSAQAVASKEAKLAAGWPEANLRWLCTE